MTARFIAPDAKVLVVDDINTNLKVASGLLAPYMMHVDLSTGGAEAVLAVKSKEYDLVFMDHKMPDMDGVEATEVIRAMGETDAYFNELPIIALTANAVTGMKEMFLENGFSDFMTKPIDTVKLNSVLEQWLPKDKQKSYANGNARAANSAGPINGSLVEIEGLNVARGAGLSRGDMGVYYETLAIFYDDAIERVRKIQKCLETNDLALYTTYIHALKGALANIGAEELSKAAFDLENAGRRGDLVYVRHSNDLFVSALERLLKNISASPASCGKDRDEATSTTDAGHIKEELERLAAALENMDAGVINRTVDELLKKPLAEDVRSIIRNISKHILMVEYEEATHPTKELIKPTSVEGGGAQRRGLTSVGSSRPQPSLAKRVAPQSRVICHCV
jgi:CheY-like chemotaxis protein